MMADGGFHYGVELVTSRGFSPPEHPDRIVALGEQLGENPKIGWLSLTDNPGGHTMLPPDCLGRILSKKKIPLVIHLACKELNRSALESAAWKYAAEGFENIAAMTGDYPKTGFGGPPTPVFDIDSVGLITLLNALNGGLQVPGKKGELTALPKTNFFIGCVTSPFKRLERELMPQYFKLLRKIASGARFVYTQLGYDMRKFHEVKLWLASHGLNPPVIGNVFLLNRAVAENFHRGAFPGCVVSDRLLDLANKYAAGPDKGQQFFLELAAKQLAVFKGLGFAGGYLAGSIKAETFFKLINLAESYGVNDWRAFAREIQFPRKDEFYLFEQNPDTGLGDSHVVNREYLRSLQNPPRSRQVTVGYRMSRWIHDRLFTPGTRGFALLKSVYTRLNGDPTPLARTLHGFEKVSKAAWFGCRDCGDCSLPECAYFCPLASCSKGARNGPCGGSSDGLCELGDKECMWARAYERLKHHGESRAMLEHPTAYYNAQLRNTSSWANTFLGRDHHAAAAAPAIKGDGRTKPEGN